MDWKNLVVVCAGTRYDRFDSSERQIARRLVDKAPVLFVDPPLSVLRMRGRRQTAGRLRIISDRFAHLAPVVQPGMNGRATGLLTERLLRLQMRRSVRKLGGDVQALIVASHRDLLGACGERVSVAYATDDFVAAASLFEVPEDTLESQQRRQASRADLAVCVSPEVAASWSKFGLETMVLRNGCDPSLGIAVDEARPWDGLRLTPPVAGFLGNVSERIDLALLEAVTRRGVSLLIVGRAGGSGEWRRRFDALVALDGVVWVGEQPPTEMPSFHAAIDVGLTPYADSTFNRASFPLKTLEYLAAGRPVVSTNLPATQWLDTELISVADDPTDFANAVAVAAATPRSADAVAARRAFAARHSWESRVEELAPHLGL